MRPPRSRHRRIHQQPAAGHGEGIEQRLLRRAAGDGIEIGHIPLVAAQPVAECARECERIPRPLLGQQHRVYGSVALPPTALRAHRTAGHEVEDRNHAHVNLSGGRNVGEECATVGLLLAPFQLFGTNRRTGIVVTREFIRRRGTRREKLERH